MIDDGSYMHGCIVFERKNGQEYGGYLYKLDTFGLIEKKKIPPAGL